VETSLKVKPQFFGTGAFLFHGMGFGIEVVQGRKEDILAHGTDISQGCF
jgi:hypothetical protein